MVDSILTNQAPVVQKPSENRSITNPAVSNASSVPEVELADDIIDVSPRTMDANPDAAFSPRGAPDLRPSINEMINNGRELRPALENFRPDDATTEKILENRIADIEVRTNNSIDETDTVNSVANANIEAFKSTDDLMQQSVDMTA